MLLPQDCELGDGERVELGRGAAQELAQLRELFSVERGQEGDVGGVAQIEPQAVELLGIELNCQLGCTRLTSKRFWRLERGLEAAVQRQRMSGEVLSIIVGHCTFAGLVCRQSLSVFKSVYGFIEKHRHEQS